MTSLNLCFFPFLFTYSAFKNENYHKAATFCSYILYNFSYMYCYKFPEIKIIMPYQKEESVFANDAKV
jgi:succinate-acetate transporter protein